MKKIVSLLLLLLPLMAVGQKSSLTLTVSGMNKGEKLVVSELRENNLTPVDTLTLDEKGMVKYSQRVVDPVVLIVAPVGNRMPQLHFVLMPREKVAVSASYDKEHSFFHVLSTKGSDNMRLYQEYNRLIGASLLDLDKQASLNKDMERLVADNSRLLMDALIATYFINSFDQHAQLFKQVRDGLASSYGNHFLVRTISERLARIVAVGMEAPEIVSIDTAGHTRKLSDLRGKVVLIDFWASWCGPCRMENPNVVRLYKKYREMGFEIFSVSLDNDQAKWVEAIQKDHLEWPNHVSDLRGWRSAAGQLYGINAIPATVLIDRDGVVLARNLRGEQLENKLKEIFGQ